MGAISNWLRRRRAVRVEWSPWSFNQGFVLCPALGVLSSEQRQSLVQLTREFLSDKIFHGAQGLDVDVDMRTRIAQLACLPVLNLGYECLLGWRDIVVYPGGFRARRHEIDEDSGLAHEWVEELAGESWDQGPLVLSWDDLITDLAQPEDHQNVVIHEIAHKLDAQTSAADGSPPLPSDIPQHRWTSTFQAAFEQLNAQLEQNAETVLIDPYAASAPEEFFAVTSEYHFLAPELLRVACPGVAELLGRYYG